MLERIGPAGRCSVGLLIAVALALASSSTALAGGGLDPSFGGDGKVTTAFPGGAFAWAVAAQGDGKVVVVGVAGGEASSGDIAVARYQPDGTLDSTFDGDGRAVTPIGTGFEEANAVAIDADGRMVVAGHDDGARFAVVRYLPDGTLDPTFGGDGVVTTNFTSGVDIAHAVVIQPNGRIVVAGRAGTRVSRFAIARYLPDGSLDPSFGGGDGKVRTRLADRSEAEAVALQVDGKIVLAGWSIPGPGFALARYRKDGTLDQSFGGGDGKVTARLGSIAIADAMAIRADGRIVVGGVRDISAFAVARFRPDGRLDRTFSRDGWASTSVAKGEHYIHGLALRPNGRVVAIGDILSHEFGDAVVPRIGLVRYTADGRLDRTFGSNGKVVTRFAGGVRATGSAKLPDGRIVVAGWAGTAPEFAVARYLR